MSDDKNEANPFEPMDVRLEISAPVSVILHPSGAMDVTFYDLTERMNSPVEERIRFDPLAASQFLDAIYAAVKERHIVFGEDQPTYFH